jgi:hypothetical protein
VVVVRDLDAFGSRYGDAVAVAAGRGDGAGRAGEFGGDLSNRGDRLTLIDARGDVIQQIDYEPTAPWPDRANGRGSSLEIIDAWGDGGDPGNWRGSDRYGGSPGRPNQTVAADILFSEILARSDDSTEDLVELRNVSARDVDISGWYLSNTDEDYFQASVGSPAVIPAFGYQVLSQAAWGFDLDGVRGDQLWLVAADRRGRPVRFVDHVQFGSAPVGVSLGPWPGQDDPLVQLAAVTFGLPNTSPRVGEVVISEVHYRPPDPDGPAGRLQADDFEFIELHNPTDQAVDLSGWSLAGGVEFLFSAGAVLGAGETWSVVGFSPDDRSKPNLFRFTLGADLSARLAGPYAPPLDDAGGTIRLLRPDDGSADRWGFRPWIVVDEVRYGGGTPWPGAAAGEGKSLTRTRPSDFGRFPTSWRAETPSPGTVDWIVRVLGDANEDGRFDRWDVAQVLEGGRYLTGRPASWQQGDWTGDGRFDQFDIVLALQQGRPLDEGVSDFRADAVDLAWKEDGIF